MATLLLSTSPEWYSSNSILCTPDLEGLVTSLHILLSDCITRVDLHFAKSILELFCRDFEKLYGVYIVKHNCAHGQFFL